MTDVISTLFSSNSKSRHTDKAGGIALICALVAIFTSCYSIHLSKANDEKSKQILLRELESIRAKQIELTLPAEENSSRYFRRSVFKGDVPGQPVSRPRNQ